MNEGKIILLLQSEDFLAKLNDASTVAETKALFQSEGFSISDEKTKIIMEALKVANQKAHDGEMLSEEELESVSGGVYIQASLALVILATMVAEGVRMGIKLHQQGSLRSGAKKLLEESKNAVVDAAVKSKDAVLKAEDTVIKWLSSPV